MLLLIACSRCPLLHVLRKNCIEVLCFRHILCQSILKIKPLHCACRKLHVISCAKYPRASWNAGNVRNLLLFSFFGRIEPIVFHEATSSKSFLYQSTCDLRRMNLFRVWLSSVGDRIAVGVENEKIHVVQNASAFET